MHLYISFAKWRPSSRAGDGLINIYMISSLIKPLFMMTSSNWNIFRVTGHLCGEFPTRRPVTRSFDVYFDLRPNKRLSKQSLGWWFETLSPPLWRHRNVILHREMWPEAVDPKRPSAYIKSLGRFSSVPLWGNKTGITSFLATCDGNW